MVTRKGLFLFYLLATAVFSPALAIAKMQWLLWILLSVVCFVIVLIFVRYFPQLIRYKNKYFEAQLFGLILGLAIFLLPSLKGTLGIFWLMIYFFRFYKTGVSLCGELSRIN